MQYFRWRVSKWPHCIAENLTLPLAWITEWVRDTSIICAYLSNIQAELSDKLPSVNSEKIDTAFKILEGHRIPRSKWVDFILKKYCFNVWLSTQHVKRRWNDSKRTKLDMILLDIHNRILMDLKMYQDVTADYYSFWESLNCSEVVYILNKN